MIKSRLISLPLTVAVLALGAVPAGALASTGSDDNPSPDCRKAGGHQTDYMRKAGGDASIIAVLHMRKAGGDGGAIIAI